MSVPVVDYGKYLDTDEARPVKAWCDDEFVFAVLADGRQIRTPMWWYPYLMNASVEERGDIEILHTGIWWTKIDEGVSIKSMLLGWKAPRAKRSKESERES